MKLRMFMVVSVISAVFLLQVAVHASQEEKSREKLDLNAATAEQLQKLPGIGPATAKSIVRFREKSGPFRRVEDLLAVRGITKARLEKLRPHVTVKSKEPEATLPPVGAD